jgi:hypothetical protein
MYENIMLHYNYYKNGSLLEVKTGEIISIDDIISHYTFIKNFTEQHDVLKVLIDCRGAKIDTNEAQLDSFTPALQGAIKRFALLKEAIIVDQPQSTVITSIFEEKYDKLRNYLFKIFCTEDAARIWLIGQELELSQPQTYIHK